MARTPKKPKTPPVAHCEKLEIDFHVVRDEEFNQLLEEWAGIVYRHFASSLDQSLVTDHLTPDLAERTGTSD